MDSDILIDSIRRKVLLWTVINTFTDRTKAMHEAVKLCLTSKGVAVRESNPGKYVLLTWNEEKETML